jgi:phosphoserine phosphatase
VISSATTEDLSSLYVDLDGTLVTTDTLWESVCLFVRRHPFQILKLPVWLLRGKASFKSLLAEQVCPDPTLLPYHRGLIDFLEQEKARGRRLVLATASHERIAHEVASQLGLFDEVLATNSSRNLRADEKLAAIIQSSGGNAFGYAGDARPDLAVWSSANEAVVISPSPQLRRSV